MKKLLCQLGLHNWELIRTTSERPIIKAYRGTFWKWTDYVKCKWCGKEDELKY